MDLNAQYARLWQEAASQLLQGCHETDPMLDAAPDVRRGITLLARPSAQIKAAIQELLQPLRSLEPEQYFYPSSDMHLTVLSLISCRPDFTLEQIDPAAYVEVTGAAIRQIPAFKVQVSGVTASPSCVMVQGFVAEPGLSRLRQNVREAFQHSGLAHTIDSRYLLQTAHSTVVRYRKPLRQPQKFLEKLQALRTVDLGTWLVQDLELVFNDWYQRQAFTQTLATFRLPSA